MLVRAATQHDPVQGLLARKLLSRAEPVVVTLPALCEFCWVLGRLYRYEPQQIAASLRLLLDAGNVEMDRNAVESGLAAFEAGGDFAGGVIAHDGRWLGGETFVSFDKTAVRLLAERGEQARILA
ncbi:type II toxin-antitoxin system VapC family toxin [Sphingomonas tagetis]|uniref:type II toxin-antitoxin system VapC family toxin n=1 Tax=Sphingomonas tagetis TaxID=2949092 RepID=UPI003F55E6B1